MPGFELIGKEEKEAVDEIFDKGGVLFRYGLDAKRENIFRVDNFEKEISQKLHIKYCHAVSSGTAALKLGLFALGVKPGDEVITQSHTFVATVEAILELGAIPIITQVDKSLNMDPEDLEKKITGKTKVIIPVHMAGVSAKMDEIMAIAQKYNIAVFEDAAQAIGATYKGKYLGTIGKAGIYSLDIGKAITTGEGGLLVTNDEELYLKARQYSDHGHEYNSALPRGEDTRTFWGFNYKITEIQGALGLAQLKKLDYVLEKQRENKKKIKDGITGLRGIEFRELPDKEGDAGDTLIFFLENEAQASQFAKLLKAEGLGTKNLPDAINWHFAGTWSHIFQDSSLWRKSEELLRRAIALPIMVKTDDEKIQEIIRILRKIAEELY
ncbi:MAG: DegT/DnrJ/EryC1/StrS family aminotransferase [Candidatus Azambacteria bacterium]|nr:DegT/DnrJ/EryC1/StrS family aminotransferase [Candidatus Azambacteria bacterium]